MKGEGERFKRESEINLGKEQSKMKVVPKECKDGFWSRTRLIEQEHIWAGTSTLHLRIV
jgi:hypothetical protein